MQCASDPNYRYETLVIPENDQMTPVKREWKICVCSAVSLSRSQRALWAPCSVQLVGPEQKKEWGAH